MGAKEKSTLESEVSTPITAFAFAIRVFICLSCSSDKTSCDVAF